MLRFVCMQISELKIDELARALKRIRGIQAAYLFGSQATRTAGSRSDVDVSILVSRRISDRSRQEVNDRAFQIVSRLLGRNDIDLVELNNAPVILRYAAIIHGRPLFVKPGHDTFRLAFRSLQEFEDFRPYLERRRRTLKKQLASI